MVLIFPNLCLWRHSLRSNVGGIHPKKLYRATLTLLIGCFFRRPKQGQQQVGTSNTDLTIADIFLGIKRLPEL